MTCRKYNSHRRQPPNSTRHRNTFWRNSTHLMLFGVFENWIPLKPVLGALTVLYPSSLSMNRLNQPRLQCLLFYCMFCFRGIISPEFTRSIFGYYPTLKVHYKIYEQNEYFKERVPWGTITSAGPQLYQTENVELIRMSINTSWFTRISSAAIDQSYLIVEKVIKND